MIFEILLQEMPWKVRAFENWLRCEGCFLDSIKWRTKIINNIAFDFHESLNQIKYISFEIVVTFPDPFIRLRYSELLINFQSVWFMPFSATSIRSHVETKGAYDTKRIPFWHRYFSAQNESIATYLSDTETFLQIHFNNFFHNYNDGRLKIT